MLRVGSQPAPAALDRLGVEQDQAKRRGASRRAVRSWSVSALGSEPVVVDVVAFENLPFGRMSSRRAVARWSDGSVSEAVRWQPGGLLFCEGDLIGKTRAAIRALYHRRARAGLARP